MLVIIICSVQGASAQCVNGEGLPAVHVAVFNGHADAVKVLIDEGADVNVRSPSSGNTALHEAVLLGPSVSRVIDTLLMYVILHTYTSKSYYTYLFHHKMIAEAHGQRRTG